MNDLRPFKEPIYITRPILPSTKAVYRKIKEIWKSKLLTNFGIQHQTLKRELIKYLEVQHLSLFCNGTIALQLACQALELTGEVITTPFTFPATTTALIQNNLKPVYCDINLHDFNIKADDIEKSITSKTSAIMPVHVFGNPCDIEKIEKIARNNNLKVIYDAAHCFGVKYKNKGIGNFGDISMFSFHATKIFHTLEGGALTYNNYEFNENLYLLKNFGIKNEELVLIPGTNAKMNELQAAIGLLNLTYFKVECMKRKKLTKVYKENLKNVQGIKYLDEKKSVEYNYQYFPILIIEKEFGFSRDSIHEILKEYNIYARKYFYPLCTDFQFLKNKEEYTVPNAKKISEQVLCLPLYGELKKKDIDKICKILIKIKFNELV